MSARLRNNVVSPAPAAVERVRRACLAWLRIYGGPEIAGLIAAAFAFGFVRACGGPLLGSALLGSWAEDVAFVGYFAVRAVRKESARHRQHHWLKYYLFTFGLAFSGLIVELGPAEAADKFVRPALLYEIPRSLHNIIAGFILAKLAADIVYYVLAYAGRVVRKRYFNNLDWTSGALRRYAIHARADHGEMGGLRRCWGRRPDAHGADFAVSGGALPLGAGQQ